ncbi:DgyrCDS13725 [Dimorphilus gyrociliatus]|uniref:DgyrCDS13725 n=1 Tax=Dimorphilus gyrociliatus TaxID=2664684 RepID=A0A7I8WBK9_9ANNE|nr:DgyrCDS13725 [Dimorphilus gyrociliatus]
MFYYFWAIFIAIFMKEWIDERLIWEASEHNNLTELIIEARKLWRPEFAVINGAERIYEDYNAFRAVISHKGFIHWEPGGVFKTMCQIDITYYPFDEQTCALTFGAWSYHTAKMNLTTSYDVINMDSYKTNGEWEVIGKRVKRNEFAYESAPNEKFSNIEFIIVLRRRHTFYVLNVILPSIMTSVLLLSVFFCTPGQKVQIGVVVLLSFRIFLLNVAGNIPKTSDHIPLLGVYLTATMAITTLSMILTVFVLNLHYVTEKPLSPFVKRLMLVYVARMLGMCSIENKPSINGKFRKRRMSVDFESNNLVTKSRQVSSKVSERIALHSKSSTSYEKYEENDDKVSDYSQDWKRLAQVFDRLFFYLFLLAILISTLILFQPLTRRPN